jgi:hypothetical protein
LHEKLGYNYDAANNLTHRTNNQLVATFTSDSRNRLSSASRTGEATVHGTATGAGTLVTANGAGGLYRRTFALRRLVSGKNGIRIPSHLVQESL